MPFDCISCIMLEYMYHAFNISNNQQYRNVKLVLGDVDLLNFTIKLNEINSGVEPGSGDEDFR